MTKRTTTTFVSLTAASAAMLMSQRVAYSAETLYDLLSKRPAHGGKASRAVPAAKTTDVALAGADGRTPERIVLPPTAAAKKRRAGFFGFLDHVGTNLRSVGKRLNTDIKVEGLYTLGFHNETVSGSNTAYQSETYYGRRSVGGALNQTDVTLRGKLLGIFNFQTHYSNNAYGNPYDNRFSLNYENREFKIDAGDINGSITGNSLLEFNRSLKGIELSAQVFKGLRLTTLYSQTKAVARTIVVNGNNTSGPYYVYAGQIVDGSEHVRVNNQDMVKGTDYTLDPYTGELQFKAGTIIHDTDSIAITFETYGYDQAPGVLNGWRADLRAAKGMNFGFTMLTQTNSQNQGVAPTKTERLQGQTAPNVPYILQYPLALTVVRDPKTAAITDLVPIGVFQLKLNGVIQTRGIDYYIVLQQYTPDRSNQFAFLRPLAQSDLIEVQYTPIREDAAPGNRQAMGVDGKIQLGSVGSLTAELGQSTLALAGQSVKGNAWQIRSDMQFLRNKLHMNWSLRNIGSDFSSIESAGFRRNDRGLSLAMDYAAAKGIKLTAALERSVRPSYSTGAVSNTISQVTGNDKYNSLNLGLAWQLGKGGQLSLTHNGSGTDMAAGGSSTYTSDNLNFTYALKSLSMDMSLGRTSGNSLAYQAQTVGVTPTQAVGYASNALTSRMNLRWRANDKLSFAALMARSDSKSYGGQSNTSQDMSITSEYSPMTNLKFSLGYQLQDSGSYGLGTTAGTTTGTTAGTTTDTTATGAAGGVRSRDAAPIIPGSGYYTGNLANVPNYSNYAGGGINAGLGGYGNNSGAYANNSYSSISPGGKSRAMNLAVNYLPARTVTLDLTWNSASSMGDYLLNSRRNDVSVTMGYTPSERFSMSSSFSLQKVAYIGQAGGTDSNMIFLNIRARPFGRLNTNLSYQRLNSNSRQDTGATSGIYSGGIYTGGTTGTTGTSGLTSYATNMDAMSLRLEYPIWKRNNLYFQIDNTNSGGYLPSVMRTMMMGIAFDMANNMVFTLGWRDQSHTSKSDGTTGGDYSYHVGSLDADFSLHF